MKNELKRVRWFQDSWDGLVDFWDEFISIIMIESILEEDLSQLRFTPENGHKKHIILWVKVDFHWSLLFLNVNIEQIEWILFSLDP